MNKLSKILILFLAFIISIIPLSVIQAGFGPGSTPLTFPETDSFVLEDYEAGFTLFYVFDLRERETFIQLTYPDALSTGLTARAHVQIFDVSNNCNENDFFDNYTINDTHVYNIRDIQTNDGNPAGVVLPNGSYGIVAITMLPIDGSGLPITDNPGHFGNLRIVDNKGYEYRTNAQGILDATGIDEEDNNFFFYSFNFNTESGVTFSDVFGITFYIGPSEQFILEAIALPVQGTFSSFDIDIYDLNEVPFSCRDIIFSCVDEDNPLLEEVLTIAGTANVASFEYGINEAIPHSKGGELLCPNNIVGNGTVLLKPESLPNTEAFADLRDQLGEGPFFAGFVGLNNGNGRGSIDSLWIFNDFVDMPIN